MFRYKHYKKISLASGLILPFLYLMKLINYSVYFKRRLFFSLLFEEKSVSYTLIFRLRFFLANELKEFETSKMKIEIIPFRF